MLIETAENARGGDLDQDGPVRGGPGGKGRAAPKYQAIRTARWLYVEYASGERELYDLRRDPDELRSVHRQRRYARTRRALDRDLSRLRSCRGAACRRPIGPIPGPTG